jgi:hypothetical protein
VLLAGRYDPWTPLGWALFGTFAAGWWAAGAVHQHRRTAAAADGPWRSVVWAGGTGPGAVAGTEDPPGTARCYLDADDPPVAVAFAVAGDLSPGAVFVSDERRDGRAAERRARSRPARASWFDR